MWMRWRESCAGWETVGFAEGKVRSGGFESCVALRCETGRGELGFHEGYAEDWFGWRADGVSLVRSAVLGDVPLGWGEGKPALERMRQVTEAGRMESGPSGAGYARAMHRALGCWVRAGGDA